jgi:hypothetical protein
MGDGYVAELTPQELPGDLEDGCACPRGDFRIRQQSDVEKHELLRIGSTCS